MKAWAGSPKGAIQVVTQGEHGSCEPHSMSWGHCKGMWKGAWTYPCWVCPLLVTELVRDTGDLGSYLSAAYLLLSVGAKEKRYKRKYI